jgi:transcriptional/translational regulatory protein YebC/TACO1
MADLTLKQNDTRGAIKATLSNESGPVDLTGATVRFLMSKVGKLKVNKQAIIQDAINGSVLVVFERVDTDESGLYQGEFEVTYSDSSVETFPNDGYVLIEIKPDLG